MGTKAIEEESKEFTENEVCTKGRLFNKWDIYKYREVGTLLWNIEPNLSSWLYAQRHRAADNPVTEKGGNATGLEINSLHQSHLGISVQ